MYSKNEPQRVRACTEAKRVLVKVVNVSNVQYQGADRPGCAANQVVLKPSPSLVHNNLCVVGAGVAYIHTRSV
jgi:hypothetical protein